MKHVIEFGKKGGFHVDNLIVPTAKLAASMACNLVCTFENDSFATTFQQWLLMPLESRKTWESESHFVAVSKLDRKDRGPASAILWREGVQFMAKQIITE
jgi:hypothetical protein